MCRLFFVVIFCASSIRLCCSQYVGRITKLTVAFNGGGNGHYVVTLSVPYNGPRCGNSPYTSVFPVDSVIGEPLFALATAALLSGSTVNANIRDCTYWPEEGPNLYDLTLCPVGVSDCSASPPGYS